MHCQDKFVSLFKFSGESKSKSEWAQFLTLILSTPCGSEQSKNPAANKDTADGCVDRALG